MFGTEMPPSARPPLPAGFDRARPVRLATCPAACQGLGDMVLTRRRAAEVALGGLFVSLGSGAGLGVSCQPDGSDPSLGGVVRP